MTAKIWGAGRRRRAAKKKPKKPKKPTTTSRALRILARRPMTATALGAELWNVCPRCGRGIKTGAVGDLAACTSCDWVGQKPQRRGRVAAATGGGDFAAQMLLGRLRKDGLVCGLPLTDGGATIWTLTFMGVKAAARAAIEESHSLAAALRRPACDCGGTPPCPHT